MVDDASWPAPVPSCGEGSGEGTGPSAVLRATWSVWPSTRRREMYGPSASCEMSFGRGSLLSRLHQSDDTCRSANQCDDRWTRKPSHALRLRADRLRDRGVVYVDEADAAALERLRQHVEREIARPHVDAVRLLRSAARYRSNFASSAPGFRLIEWCAYDARSPAPKNGPL